MTCAFGEEHYNAKLSAEDVELIRQLGDERQRLYREALKLSNAAIAEKFGVTKRCIDRVINYQTRKQG